MHYRPSGGYVPISSSRPARHAHTPSQVVDLGSFDAVQSYLANVPPAYSRYIRTLTISTNRAQFGGFPSDAVSNDVRTVSDTLAQLLDSCPQVERLTLHLDGSLTKNVIPTFQNFHQLSVLSINHCGDEQHAPLYVATATYLVA